MADTTRNSFYLKRHSVIALSLGSLELPLRGRADGPSVSRTVLSHGPIDRFIAVLIWGLL